MDLALVLLFLIITGILKVSKQEPSGLVLQPDGTVNYNNTLDIPIGDNLSLEKEEAAYTLILRQFNLL